MLNSILYRAAKKYIRWADGFSYEFSKNGEEWLLRTLVPLNFDTIFDVGANVGEWTRSAHSFFPESDLHCFELSEATFETLTQNVKHFPKIRLNNFGLSDSRGNFRYKDYGVNSGVNTILLEADYHDKSVMHTLKEGYLETGDAYCRKNFIEKIDFLKIDVEGAEHMVLRGFHDTLLKGAVRVIQFEYGYTHGDAKFLMRDFYKMFDDIGYRVGLLRKNEVRFIDWNYTLNDFNSGPNFIAVRKSDLELIQMLSLT